MSPAVDTHPRVLFGEPVLRAFEAPVPIRRDGRRVIGWQMDVSLDGVGWRQVQGGAVEPGDTIAVGAGRAGETDNWLRVHFVADGGAGLPGGLMRGQPVRIDKRDGAVTYVTDASAPRGRGAGGIRR